MSRALCQRASGSFSRQRRMIHSSIGGVTGTSSDGFRGSVARIAAITLDGDLPSIEPGDRTNHLVPVRLQEIEEARVREDLDVRVVVEIRRRAVLEVRLHQNKPAALAQDPANRVERQDELLSRQMLDEVAGKRDVERILRKEGEVGGRVQMRHDAGRRVLRTLGEQVYRVTRGSAGDVVDEIAVSRAQVEHARTVWNVALLNPAHDHFPDEVTPRIEGKARLEVRVVQLSDRLVAPNARTRSAAVFPIELHQTPPPIDRRLLPQ